MAGHLKEARKISNDRDNSLFGKELRRLIAVIKKVKAGVNEHLPICELLAATIMLVLCLNLVGCGNDGGGGSGGGATGNQITGDSGMVYDWPDGSIAPWYMPAPPKTGIDPLPGHYTFTPQDPSGLNGKETFEVIEESGKKYVRFASDAYRFDKIEIAEGAFHNEWGYGISGWATDGYAISGCFTSKSRAEGRYKYIGDSEIIQGKTNFIATTEQQ